MVKLTIPLTLISSLSLSLAHSHHDSYKNLPRDPKIDFENELALRKLKIRHPHVRAYVEGQEVGFNLDRRAGAAEDSPEGNNFEKRKPQAASTSPAAAGTLTFTGPGIDTAAILALGSTTTPEQTLPLPTTYPAGSKTPINGAPPLPVVNIIPSNYPALDLIPPTNTSQVQQWLSQIDLTKVPNIPVNQLGGCQNASNAQAVANAQTNGWWTCGGYTRSSDITECPTKNTWGVTYDDGPSPDTPRLLNYLDAHQIKVTFFIVGSRAISRPNTMQYEYMDGHQLCVHTWSHTALTTETNEQVVAELAWTKQAMKDILGVTPNCMRPPYGDIDDRVRYISLAMGLTPIIWTSANGVDFDSQDWQIGAGIVTPVTVANNFATILRSANSLSTGFICLEHDLYQQSTTLAIDFALPFSATITPALTYQPVIECIGKTMADSYIETATNTSTGAGSTGTGTVPGISPSGSKKPSMGMKLNVSGAMLALLTLMLGAWITL